MALPLISPAAAETVSATASQTGAGRRIGRIEIDRDLCIGAESCVIVAPDVFEMDDTQIAILKDPKGADDDTILQSAQACPVAAIILYDEEGNQMYP